MDEPKDSMATPPPSPHTTPVPFPHATPVPSPQHSPVMLVQSSGSPIQIVDLGDGESSSSESTNSKEAMKKTTEVEKRKEVPKNPFAPPTVKATPAKRKMFSVESLGTTSKVISIESWLEDTLERKRRRKEENTPTKDAVSLAVSFGSTLARVKKQKPLSILGHDLATGHLTMEIAKPNKE